MKIGMFVAPQYEPGADVARGFEEVLEQVRAARANGFSSVFVAQHMLTGPKMQMLQTVPTMARLIPEIEGMQIGPGVMLISMVNPVMVAEEGATLDWLSGGNYVLGGGLGYRDVEFEALGTQRSHRVSRLEEAIEVIKRLWTEERVTHHGRHFNLSDVGICVRPKQSPRPPIWLGGDVDAAIRRAARIADTWLASPTASKSRLDEEFAAFADERTKHGLDVPACPIMRECFVGRDASHAREVSAGPLQFKYAAYARWGHRDTHGQDMGSDFESFCEDRFLVGDVGRIREELLDYAERLKTDHLILRVTWPGLDQAEAIAGIDRIGQALASLSA